MEKATKTRVCIAALCVLLIAAVIGLFAMNGGKQQASRDLAAAQSNLAAMQTQLTGVQGERQALQERLNKLEAHGQKSDEVIGQALSELRQMAQANGDRKLMGIVGRISDLDDVLGEKAVRRTDNVLVTQIVDEAVVASGIDRASYLTFVREVAPDAAATMLSTNLVKAVRALTHLLDNALKFTSEGKVTLRAAVDMDKMIAIYTVEDTGSGIAPDDAERIFEPYVKLNQFFGGQGIGLTVARNIARRLEGDVVLDSTYEGPGSRFVLTLPI